MKLQRLAKYPGYLSGVRAVWCRENNWGDALNAYLIPMLSGRSVRYCDSSRFSKYLCVGSICHLMDSKTIVWGAGCIRANQRCAKPLRVCAVRGPLTRETLIGQGIGVPEVYGDPALLMPFLYSPARTKHYRIGLIPHYVDEHHPWVQKAATDPDVLLIDVRDPVLEFVDRVNACELVLSSSLHGIICADAYGVPSVWIELSDKIVGNRFKYRDYMMSVGRDQMEPVVVESDMKLRDAAAAAEPYAIHYSPRDLLMSCPFRSKRRWPDAWVDTLRAGVQAAL